MLVMLAGLIMLVYLMVDLFNLMMLVRFLVNSAEGQIHYKDQPRDHDRYKQNRSILCLRVLFKLSNEMDEKLPTVDDLSEHHGHYHNKERQFSPI